jgi:glutathione synthase/RimK-type ligase-like ATP-grasp enzyme
VRRLGPAGALHGTFVFAKGSPMILILSNRDDLHASRVADKLRERGAAIACVDHRQFPAQARISLRYEDRVAKAIWRTTEGDLDLSALTGIWHRRPYLPRPDPRIESDALRKAITDDSDLFLRDLWNATECLTVPAPTLVYRRADLKATQLACAIRLGLEVPDTLITNDPQEVLAFHRKHDGRIISKLASPVINRDYLAEGVRYTNVVSHRDIGYVQSVRHGPVIFQGYVPKRLELRITIIGDAIFPVEIHSQSARRTRHDWRHYDHFNTPMYPHALPAEVERQLRALVAQQGLCFGAIDMVLTPDDRYVFLELNPNGQFLWMEDLMGLPMSDAMCDLLMSSSRRAHRPATESVHRVACGVMS